MKYRSEAALRYSLPFSALRAGGSLFLALSLSACIFDSDHSSDPAPPAPPSPPAQGVVCKDYDGKDMMVKPKTITIHNNSAESTIYPVLATSKNAKNEWIQGCFRTAEPYPTNYVYKLYVNEGQGIPPNSSVTITLPLYSKLSDERYITWWNGGRVVLADSGERLRGQPDTALDTPSDVSCQAHNTECKLSTYASDVQFPENIYAQLSEYTFGDSIIPVGQNERLLKPENVGYNISYVDHVYMPVAIGPKNNPYIGYSGSTQPLSHFSDQLAAFLKSDVGEGWPVYNLEKLKLPGGYNIFAQRSGTLPPDDNVPVKPSEGFPPVLTVSKCIEGGCTEEEKKNLHFGTAVQRMQNLWGSCVDWGDENIDRYVNNRITCPADMKERLEAVKRFFEENHRKYLALYGSGQCEGNTPIKPEFNYWEAVVHIYGWVPFNEGCGADANPLAETTIQGWDHAKIQSMYIHELQYNHQQPAVQADHNLLFNPYVQLIHDDLEMNAYGFSVDDAVGFMSELGDGLIFTVGGPQGLENPQQFNYADGFSVAVGVPGELDGRQNMPLIKKYGVCVLDRDVDPGCENIEQDVVMPDNSQIAGFRVGTVPSYPIKLRFTDMNDNVYTLRVNTKFAKCPEGFSSEQCPTNKDAIVDKQACSVVDSKGATHPKSENWCLGANPNQQKEKQLTKNFISYPPPVDYMQ